MFSIQITLWIKLILNVNSDLKSSQSFNSVEFLWESEKQHSLRDFMQSACMSFERQAICYLSDNIASFNPRLPDPSLGNWIYKLNSVAILCRHFGIKNLCVSGRSKNDRRGTCLRIVTRLLTKSLTISCAY